MQLYVLLSLCGVALSNTESYGYSHVDDLIIGGDKVTQLGKWPWQGSLQSYGGHICGISLIGTYWGVTAAHCVEGKSVSQLSFRFGINRRGTGGVVVSAYQVIMHEWYDIGDGALPNDIAVVQFDRPVSGPYISTVPLTPSGRDHAGNRNCWITGWGVTSGGGGTPEMDLREAKVNVYTKAACIAEWGFIINDGHVCIGDSVNGRTSCQGDSGGPLVCYVNGRYELVGATSWGPAGCTPSRPAGYSRIAYFRNWIREKTGGL